MEEPTCHLHSLCRYTAQAFLEHLKIQDHGREQGKRQVKKLNTNS